MIKHKIAISIILVLMKLLPMHGVLAQRVAPFKENDRVVFLGNSITDGGHYHSYIWLYYMTRYPQMKLLFLNAGIGGDRAIEMLRRLDGDVFSKQPTVLIATFGMNDTGYFEYNGSEPDKFADTKVKESYDAFKQMEARFAGLSNTRIVLVGSTPYDEGVIIEGNQPFKNKNKAMMRVVDFQKEAAKERSWEFFDFNEPMTAINRQFQQNDPSFTICGNDRVHPDNDGHMVMAYLFLKAQGMVGNKVSETMIDAEKQQVLNANNCQISNIQKTETAISFDYLAAALPYPLDTTARGWGSKKSQAEALKVVPFMEEMNQELLVVKGLKGKGRLLIDGEIIGEWTAAEYAKGINLAAQHNTPQYQQALRMMYLNEERWEIDRRFRDYAWVQYNFFQPKGMLDANNRKAIELMDQHVGQDGWLRAKRDLYAKAMFPEVRKAWQDQIDHLHAQIVQISDPKSRKVEIITIK